MSFKEMIDTVNKVFDSCETQEQKVVAWIWSNSYNKKYNSVITSKGYRKYSPEYSVLDEIIDSRFNEVK